MPKQITDSQVLLFYFIIIIFFFTNKGVLTSSNMWLFSWVYVVFFPSHTHQVIIERNPSSIFFKDYIILIFFILPIVCSVN